MSYTDELDKNKAHQRLAEMRDWYRANILLKWHEWMPGTKILAWRLDKLMFLRQQKIENRIYSRRVAEYHKEKYAKYVLSSRFDREIPSMKFYAPWEVPEGLGVIYKDGRVWCVK